MNKEPIKYTENSDHIQFIWSSNSEHYPEHESDISLAEEALCSTTKAFYQDCSRRLS